MFPMTVTIHNQEQLAALLTALGAPAMEVQATAYGKLVKSITSVDGSNPKTATEKPKAEPVKLTTEQQNAVDDTAGLGKSAPAASSQPTAEVVKADAPVKKVEYSELQAAVLTLHKLDATAAKPIAEVMGFPNFKAMPEERWAEALAAVLAKTEEVKGGV